MKTVEMPKMGDTMEEGKILRWIKQEGDQVKRGESLAEVETDKVNIEIESFASGVLRKILVAEGESAPIGAGIALIGASDEPLPDSLSGNGAVKTAATRESVQAATTGAESEQTLNEARGGYQATQAIVQSPAGSQDRIFISPIARRIAEEHNFDYSQVEGTGPNGRIIKLDIEAALAQKPEAVARRIAEEHHFDYSQVEGTGPNGRIIKLDIEAALAQKPEAVAPVIAAQLPVLEAEPAPIEVSDATEVPLSAMRRTIAKRLSQSMQTAPHFYVTSVIDTGKLADLRRQVNEYAQNEPEPIKVSFNDLIVKAVAIALVRMPQVAIALVRMPQAMSHSRKIA